jgi:hypothetical protein
VVTSDQERLRHLVSLLQVHLLREYGDDEWLQSDAETCDFFRAKLQSTPKSAAQPPRMMPVAKPVPAVKMEKSVPRVTPTPKPIEQKSTPSVENVKKPLEMQPFKKSNAIQADWKDVLKHVAPQMKVLETPQHTEPKVWVLVDLQIPLSHQTFLRNMCQAITIMYEPACIAKECKPHAEVKLIISNKPIAHQNALVISDIESILNNPDQKAALWLQVSSKLCPTPPSS